MFIVICWQIWKEAIQQVFYSLSVGLCPIIMLSSYNKFNHDFQRLVQAELVYSVIDEILLLLWPQHFSLLIFSRSVHYVAHSYLILIFTIMKKNLFVFRLVLVLINIITLMCRKLCKQLINVHYDKKLTVLWCSFLSYNSKYNILI